MNEPTDRNPESGATPPHRPHRRRTVLLLGVAAVAGVTALGLSAAVADSSTPDNSASHRTYDGPRSEAPADTEDPEQNTERGDRNDKDGKDGDCRDAATAHGDKDDRTMEGGGHHPARDGQKRPAAASHGTQESSDSQK